MKKCIVALAAIVLLFTAAPAVALPPGPHPPGTADYQPTDYTGDYLYVGEAGFALTHLPNLFTDFGTTCHPAYAYRGASWDESGRLAAFFPCAAQYWVSHANYSRIDRNTVHVWAMVYRPNQRVYCIYYGRVRKYRDANGYWSEYVIQGTQGVQSCATY